MQQQAVPAAGVQLHRPKLGAWPAVVELVPDVPGLPVERGPGAVRVAVHPPTLGSENNNSLYGNENNLFVWGFTFHKPH